MKMMVKTLLIRLQEITIFIYKDKGEQVLPTNVHPSGNFDKFTKQVKVTYCHDSKGSESNQKQTRSGMQNVSHGTSSNSASYVNSAYLSLRRLINQLIDYS